MWFNIVYNILCSSSPEHGQLLLGFHKNCCFLRTARAERRSSSSAGTAAAAISRRAVMSRIVRCICCQKRSDISLYVLPDRSVSKRARYCMQRARQGIGIQPERPGIQRAQRDISIQRELPCMQHVLPGINARCMTVGKA